MRVRASMHVAVPALVHAFACVRTIPCMCVCARVHA